jgi:hypothetical protein
MRTALLCTFLLLMFQPFQAYAKLCVQCGTNSCYFAERVGFASCRVLGEGGTECSGTCGRSDSVGDDFPSWWNWPSFPTPIYDDPYNNDPTFPINSSTKAAALSSSSRTKQAAASVKSSANQIRPERDDVFGSPHGFWGAKALPDNAALASSVNADPLLTSALAALRHWADRTNSDVKNFGAFNFVFSDDPRVLGAFRASKRSRIPSNLANPHFGGYAEYRLVQISPTAVTLQLNAWKLLLPDERPVEGKVLRMNFRKVGSSYMQDAVSVVESMPEQLLGRFAGRP